VSSKVFGVFRFYLELRASVTLHVKSGFSCKIIHAAGQVKHPPFCPEVPRQHCHG
jgi:hypothetical protein